MTGLAESIATAGEATDSGLGGGGGLGVYKLSTYLLVGVDTRPLPSGEVRVQFGEPKSVSTDSYGMPPKAISRSSRARRTGRAGGGGDIKVGIEPSKGATWSKSRNKGRLGTGGGAGCMSTMVSDGSGRLGWAE